MLHDPHHMLELVSAWIRLDCEALSESYLRSAFRRSLSISAALLVGSDWKVAFEARRCISFIELHS